MKRLMIGIALIALAAGCTTDKIHEWMRAKPVPLTDFLPENERLVRRPDTFLVHYTWLDTNAVVAAEFKNVHIAPFDLSRLPKGKGYDSLRDKLIGLDNAIDDLGEFGRNAFVKAFRDREGATALKVVDDPKTPHTLILEFAITAFVPTRAALEAAGAIGGLFCPIPGVGLVADYLSAGMIAIECRARNSDTGRIVAMFADTEGEPTALLQYSKFSYTAAAKINLKKLANEVAQSCAIDVDERVALRRPFPIDFIALPFGNDL